MLFVPIMFSALLCGTAFGHVLRTAPIGRKLLAFVIAWVLHSALWVWCYAIMAAGTGGIGAAGSFLTASASFPRER